ncbi:MAG: hypothetical protein JWP57_4656, partial [Spirosoma sp.]|nr:hypothetical protein [Spirosoma sp.]
PSSLTIKARGELLVPPSWLIVRTFCAECGWMYQKTPISPALRAAVERRDSEECVYCGLKKSSGYEFTCDHVLAEIDGGATDIENLVFCCQSCNSSKGRKVNWAKPRFGRYAVREEEPLREGPQTIEEEILWRRREKYGEKGRTPGLADSHWLTDNRLKFWGIIQPSSHKEIKLAPRQIKRTVAINRAWLDLARIVYTERREMNRSELDLVLKWRAELAGIEEESQENRS